MYRVAGRRFLFVVFSLPPLIHPEIENLAFLYRNKHISASLSPASFATATMLVRQKSDRYVTVFLSEEGKVLFEGLEDHFHDRAWQGVNRKVAQVVSSVLGAYETVK
jgi:hypothetical protein